MVFLRILMESYIHHSWFQDIFVRWSLLSLTCFQPVWTLDGTFHLNGLQQLEPAFFYIYQYFIHLTFILTLLFVTGSQPRLVLNLQYSFFCLVGVEFADICHHGRKFHFMAVAMFDLCIYQLINVWVIMTNGPVSICIHAYVWTCTFLLGRWLGVKLLGHELILYLTIWGTARWFSIVAEEFYFPSIIMWSF